MVLRPSLFSKIVSLAKLHCWCLFRKLKTKQNYYHVVLCVTLDFSVLCSCLWAQREQEHTGRLLPSSTRSR